MYEKREGAKLDVISIRDFSEASVDVIVFVNLHEVEFENNQIHYHPNRDQNCRTLQHPPIFLQWTSIVLEVNALGTVEWYQHNK